MTQGPPEGAAARARQLGARTGWVYDIIDGFAAEVPAARLDDLAALPEVRRIFLDRPTTTLMDISHKAIQADHGWAGGHRGKGVTVAVLDTGIDATHPFFAGAVVSCVSTIDVVLTVYSPECTDTSGHGTHVAGTVASRDRTFPGIAPEAKLAVVRVLQAAGAGFSSDSIAGMDWVRNNKDKVSPPIRVATMSVGPLQPECGNNSSPDAVAANALVDSGVFFSVAAGNSGHKDADGRNLCTIDGAAAASKVTTVAAVDDRKTVQQSDDVIAGFSSGGSKDNGKPDVSFPGVDIRSSFLGPTTISLDGTSMATPHAAGTAALLAGKEPGLTAQQLKDRITSSAVKNGNTGNAFNHVYGHGLGNACKALGLGTCSGSITAPAPLVQLSPSALDFGPQQVAGSSAARTVTLSNPGNFPLTIRSIAVSPDYVQTNNCPAALEGGTSCAVQISFRPLFPGVRSGSLEVSHNGPGSPHSVALTGTGTLPQPTGTPPTSVLTIDDVVTTEGSTGPTTTKAFDFKVTLIPARPTPVEVGYFAGQATAKPPGDYHSVSGKLTFNPGETAKTITVPVVADNTPERDEVFQVFLTNPTNSVVGKPQAIGVIRDDDGGNAPPAITISDVVQAEGSRAGTTDFVFKVSLTAPSGNRTVTVKYTTANGTAEAQPGKNDYTPSFGSISFAPGETEKTFTVAVTADTTIERSEFFQVFLTDAVNAVTAKSRAVGVVINDDGSPLALP